MNLKTPPPPSPEKTLLVFYPDPINGLRNLIQKFILSQKYGSGTRSKGVKQKKNLTFVSYISIYQRGCASGCFPHASWQNFTRYAKLDRNHW